MKFILTLFFCIIAILGWVEPACAQQQPVLTDEINRRLGGDPDKARAEAAKRALESPTSEEKANYARATEMSATITDDIIANIPSNDPLLGAFYRNRTGMVMEGPNPAPWLSVVDRDIRRRPEAKDIFKAMLREMKCYNCRAYPLFWLTKNADVPWGSEIMEEAIKLYRADPNKWESGQIGILCRLIMLRGNESHLEFLDELNAKGIGDNGAARAIRRRLDQAGKTKTAELGTPTSPIKNTPVSLMNQSTPSRSSYDQIFWLAGGAFAVIAGFWLWRLKHKP